MNINFRSYNLCVSFETEQFLSLLHLQVSTLQASGSLPV